MNTISITFVTPWYGYFAGGAEVAGRSLAEQLVKIGFSVQVLTTCCRCPFDNWWLNTLPAGVENINGVTVRRFSVDQQGESFYHEVNYRIINRMKVDEGHQRQFIQNSINSKELIDYANANTKDHLVIGMPFTQGLIYSLIQTLAGRASLLPCFHNEPQLRWITTAETLDKSQKIFFLTEEEKTLAIQHFGHRFGRKIVESPVIGVGVELPDNIQSLINEYTRKDILSKYNLPEKFFVYVGRKDIGKNILSLINYFRYYLANDGEAILVFLGGGDTSLVPTEKGFIDLQFIPEEDKYLVISQALGLINLSQNESFSLVLMEAWLCETPVVVHQDCEVTAGHCQKSKGGIAISSKEEFNAALNTLNCPDTNKKLAILGKYYVHSNYSWTSVLEHFLRELNQE
jgi:glycosyltransferase involved in cell wall biosynthesis